MKCTEPRMRRTCHAPYLWSIRLAQSTEESRPTASVSRRSAKANEEGNQNGQSDDSADDAAAEAGDREAGAAVGGADLLHADRAQRHPDAGDDQAGEGDPAEDQSHNSCDETGDAHPV